MLVMIFDDTLSAWGEVHAGEMPTAQLLEDAEIVNLCLESEDGIENTQEIGLTRQGGVDDVLDDLGVFMGK